MNINALVPELAVTDIAASLEFYRLLGFSVAYRRPEEGFAFLVLGEAQIMLDQIGQGRDLDRDMAGPLGRGMNLQIMVPDIERVADRLAHAGITLLLPLETRQYRRDEHTVVQRQLVVADPDGYLLRFAQVIV